MKRGKVKTKNSEKNSDAAIDDGKAKRLANIEPHKFQPGQSGNPSGRPPGKRNFDTLVDLAIEALAAEYVKQWNKKHKTKQITIDDVDIESDIFKQLVNRARNGDQKAIDSFLDRRHGKPVQPIKNSNDPEDPLVQAQIRAVEAEIEAWERGWEEIGVMSGNKKNNGNNNSNKRTTRQGSR